MNLKGHECGHHGITNLSMIYQNESLATNLNSSFYIYEHIAAAGVDSFAKGGSSIKEY